MNRPRIVIKHRRARPFFARHPWVFAQSIARFEGDLQPGDEVDVVSHEGTFIAAGLYNPRSAIRVRLYRWDDGPLDDAFWNGRIDAALTLRRDVLKVDNPGGACRLIASESDGISGLTVDRYDRTLVVQFTSLALIARREMFVTSLAERTGVDGIWLRTEKGIAGAEGLQATQELAFGTVPEEPVTIVENDLTFLVDPRVGQKTGFYLDQRENRRAAARYAEGRRVLDLFCHGGGFALNALKHGGAREAFGVDRSEHAIELARRNAAANDLSHSVQFETSDVFEMLGELKKSNEQFDMIVCDPPKFAPKSHDVEDALKGYLRLNRAAVEVLSPEGILVTCSCSGNVDRGMFADMLGTAAELTGRPIQLLEQRGQAPDHPVSASCLETEYLKCVIARVS
jgi:23S rRNA (cytosine1962-C5)-methyltransferase